MELLQLQYFQAVAKHENITKAAEELHISQPALSITIKRLETELNIPLFNREGKKIKINSFGKQFLKHINSIMNEIENAKSELLELYGEKNNHISISSTASLLLQGVLKDFLTINPNITINQRIDSQESIVEKLKNRTIDFAITSSSIKDAELKSIELLEEEIVVVMPKSHKFANKGFINLKELKDENFIELTENYSFKNISEKLFEEAGFVPNIIFQVDSTIMPEILQTGRAISLIPLSACVSSKSTENVIARLKDKNNTRKISLYFKKGRYFSELSNNFLKFTIDYYKNSWFTIKNTNNEYLKTLFNMAD